DASITEPTARRGGADGAAKDHHAETVSEPHGATVGLASSHTGAASPTEDAPGDVHVAPEDHPTLAPVGAQPATAPRLPAPVPTLAPGSMLAHVRGSLDVHGGVVPPPAHATSRAAAPAALAGEGTATSDVGGAAEPTGALPSVAAAMPAAAPPIRFQAQPAREGDPDRDAAEAQANAFASASQQRMCSLRSQVDTSARALEPRLIAGDQAIDAAKAKSEAAIHAAMGQLRTGAATRVAAASAEI